MPVTITNTARHYYLDSWILASVLHLGTVEFCKSFLNNNNDPGGRQFAQMTQAARSCPANIAEGSARRDTSVETMMKLTDVARATLSELAYDFLFLLASNGKLPWSDTDYNYKTVISLDLPKPYYSHAFMHDVGQHIIKCNALFDRWFHSNDWTMAANALLLLCGRIDRMITRQLERQLQTFSNEGGFTENLTQTRLEAKQKSARESGAPVCPKCGKPMIKQTAKRGPRQGQQFWGCSGYPECDVTRSIKP